MAKKLNKTVVVAVDGIKYDGWKVATIEKSVENLCGSFSLDVVNDWVSGQDFNPDIKAGSKVEIFLLNEFKTESTLVMTGYADVETVGFNGTGTYINISGRDITSDLVDCTLTPPYEKKELGPVALIEEMAKEFGISVDAKIDKDVNDVGIQKYKAQVMSVDSKISDEIKKIATAYGFLTYTNEKGEIVISNEAESDMKGKLIQGVNVLSARRVYNMVDQYSDIAVLGQTSDDGIDLAENITGLSRDETIRKRLLTIIGPENIDTTKAEAYASWYRRATTAKATTLTVVVAGWDTEDGELYGVNKTIGCVLPSIGVAEFSTKKMLIKGVNFSMDEKGKRTTLTLVDRDAYNSNGEGITGSNAVSGVV